MHPSPVQIFQFWQIYLTSVNPLLKITHTPSLQGQLVEATSHLGDVPKALEALMFAVYLIAVSSLPEDEALRKFNEEKKALVAKYSAATQQALVNARFMCTSDVMVVQAYLLYLVGAPHRLL
jgi:hypothetical protein